MEAIADMCSVWGGGRYSVSRLEKVLRRLGEAEIGSLGPTQRAVVGGKEPQGLDVSLLVSDQAGGSWGWRRSRHRALQPRGLDTPIETSLSAP